MRLRVRLTLVSTEDGGRRTGVAAGFRCAWRSDRKPEWNDAVIDPDRGLEPGDSCDAWLRLGVPHRWHGAVVAGDVLEGAEGSRVVLRATVLEDGPG